MDSDFALDTIYITRLIRRYIQSILDTPFSVNCEYSFQIRGIVNWNQKFILIPTQNSTYHNYNTGKSNEELADVIDFASKRTELSLSCLKSQFNQLFSSCFSSTTHERWLFAASTYLYFDFTLVYSVVGITQQLLILITQPIISQEPPPYFVDSKLIL